MPAILSTPTGRPSLHDDLLFVVYDGVKANDPVTYPDYRYICDVYNNTELVARLKAYPQPDSKFGVFNLRDIFKSYVNPTLNPTPDSFLAQKMTTGEWNVSGTCVFGEEYGFTQFLNVSGDTGKFFYNHYNGRKLGVTTKLIAEANFKSERPRTTSIYRDTTNVFVPYLNVSLSNTVSVTVTLYDSSGGSLGTNTDNITIPAVATIGVVNIGISGIEAFMGSPLPENTAYFDVSLTSTLHDAQTFRVNVLCEPKYDIYTLHFLNRWGAWETKDFTKKSKKSIDIQKSDFGKLPYTISDAGVPQYYSSGNVYNETRSVYASQYKEKLLLNSDNLSDAEYEWLQDLVLSPMVFVEMEESGNIYHVPCVITNTDYELKKGVNEKTSNLTIQVEFGDQLNSQYR